MAKTFVFRDRGRQVPVPRNIFNPCPEPRCPSCPLPNPPLQSPTSNACTLLSYHVHPKPLSIALATLLPPPTPDLFTYLPVPVSVAQPSFRHTPPPLQPSPSPSVSQRRTHCIEHANMIIYLYLVTYSVFKTLPKLELELGAGAVTSGH